MKHPHDRYTLELIPANVKRGRGRPRKDNALTPAERARRYRANKRAAPALPWWQDPANIVNPITRKTPAEQRLFS